MLLDFIFVIGLNYHIKGYVYMYVCMLCFFPHVLVSTVNLIHYASKWQPPFFMLLRCSLFGAPSSWPWWWWCWWVTVKHEVVNWYIAASHVPSSEPPGRRSGPAAFYLQHYHGRTTNSLCCLFCLASSATTTTLLPSSTLPLSSSSLITASLCNIPLFCRIYVFCHHVVPTLWSAGHHSLLTCLPFCLS